MTRYSAGGQLMHTIALGHYLWITPHAEVVLRESPHLFKMAIAADPSTLQPLLAHATSLAVEDGFAYLTIPFGSFDAADGPNYSTLRMALGATP
jgi:hypothetical protein